VLELPRSVRLAAWGSAVLAGAVDVPTAVRAVTADDEPHAVAPAAGGTAADLGLSPAAGLAELLSALGARGSRRLRVVLPTAGDPLGLPGPPAVNVAAIDAGEAVITDPAVRPLALIPDVTEFGSTWEPGTLVRWYVHAADDRPVVDADGIADADRALRRALAAATDELVRLDLARWREDAAERLAAVRDGGLDRRLLPPSLPAPCLRVVATAARVRAIVALAAEDDGAAVSGTEMVRRAETLRGLDGVARRAMATAVNAAAATA
jgi:hypothetical protein